MTGLKLTRRGWAVFVAAGLLAGIATGSVSPFCEKIDPTTAYQLEESP